MILRRPKPKLFLSLTPLIDVVFILLIFFMLVSQFSDWRQIDLVPQIEASGAVSDEPVRRLQLLNDGSFLLDGEMASGLSEVTAKLPSAKRDGVLVLSTEDAVQIQRVVDVVEALKSEGVSDIRLFETPDRSER